MTRFLGLVLLGLAVLFPLPACAALQQLTNLFVFGDSLSDAGNSGLRSQEFTNNPNIVFPPRLRSNISGICTTPEIREHSSLRSQVERTTRSVGRPRGLRTTTP